MHTTGGGAVRRAARRRGQVVVVLLLTGAVAGPVVGFPARAAGAAALPLALENSVTQHGTLTAAGPAGPAGISLSQPLVGLAATPSGAGSWAAAADGGVFTSGDALYFGSLGGRRLSAPVVSIVATPSGSGYWLAASDGGVFAFGDAPFSGSAVGVSRNAPIVAMTATPTGRGYWLAAADGGVFSFGDAGFFGSPAGTLLNAPVVAMAASTTGHGYWLAASDGGVFAFGDAPPLGSVVGLRLNAPIVGLAATPAGAGYWLAAGDGGVFTFGDAAYRGGDAGAAAGTAPGVVGITADPTGAGYWLVHGTRFGMAAPGSRGPEVIRIQARLRDLGYWVGPITGDFGFLTVQAVYAFQKVQRLPVTGRVDATTAARLASSDRPAPGRGGDLVEVDKTRQVLFVVRSGQVVWAFNTSTGSGRPYGTRRAPKLAVTPEGAFTFDHQVNGYHRGPLGVLYRPKYFTAAGHAIHGYSSVPPVPASHGCVRVSNPAMDFLWGSGLVPLGSPIWVHRSG